MRKVVTTVAVCGMLLFSAAAFADSITILGTDLVSLHQEATFGTELFNHLAGGSTLPILVLNNFGGGGSGYAGGPGFVFVGSLNGINLNDYSALFVASPGRCCNDPSSLLAGFQNEVASYLASGGNLAIEDFGGNFGGSAYSASVWTPIFGFDPTAGITYATNPDNSCENYLNPTSQGTAEGYTSIGPVGCTAHQGYNAAFFAAHGFNLLMTSEHGYDVVLEGSAAVPEPASLTLFGSGLLALSGLLRRKLKA